MQDELTCDLELCEPVYVAIYGFPQCPLGHDLLQPNGPSYPKNTDLQIIKLKSTQTCKISYLCLIDFTG